MDGQRSRLKWKGEIKNKEDIPENSNKAKSESLGGGLSSPIFPNQRKA